MDRIVSSCLVNHPDFEGKVETSAWLGAGRISAGMIHLGGMEAIRPSRLAFEMVSQFPFAEAMVDDRSALLIDTASGKR